MNIALLSPAESAYSETFIKAHKDLLQGNIFYYFSGELPNRLENGLVINSRRKRVLDIVKGHFRLNKFSLEEQALITSFRDNEIEIVLAEYGGTGTKILPVCKELSLPLIVHFHGSDASKHVLLESNNNYLELFEYANYIVVVSKKMYTDFLHLGCPEEKLIYNVYGPREKFLQVTPKFTYPQFVSAGRFVEKKAPYYLILSFLKILHRYPEARLIMAGDGILFDTSKNLIKYFGLEDKIFLVGVIDSDEFIRYLAESLAFIQHSITSEDGDAEGTPLTILEASSAGVPVISTFHAGIPDIIINEDTGFLVQEHDVDGMSENMVKLLEDKELALRMGARGKENISRNFTLEKHIAILNGLIQDTLKKVGNSKRR